MSATDGWPTNTGWNRRSSAASFSMCLRYSSSVVAPTARSSPRASIGFSRFAASTAPSAAPAPTMVCSSSMKRTISPAAFSISRQHGLQPLLELAAVLRAREERAEVERPDALPLEPLGHVSRDDPLREPLHDRGLAHAGIADEDGIVLRAAREHLDHAPDLLVAPDDRVELPGLGERGEVAAVLLERLVRALGILRRHLLAAADALQRLEQRLARDDVEREQQMLHRDELVAELPHLVERPVEDATDRRRRLRLSAARDRRQLTHARLRLRAQRRGAVPGTVDERPRQLLLEERDRQVVGRELRVARAPRELLGARDRFLRLERQLVEVHVTPSSRDGIRGCTGRARACRSGAPRRSPRAAPARAAPCAPASAAARPRGGAPARHRRD